MVGGAIVGAEMGAETGLGIGALGGAVVGGLPGGVFGSMTAKRKIEEWTGLAVIIKARQNVEELKKKRKKEQ